MSDDHALTEIPTDTASEAVPTPRRRGAPAGNVNASRDPGFTKQMRRAQDAARKDRAARRRSCDAEHLQMVEAAGLDPRGPLGREALTLSAIAHEMRERGRVAARLPAARRDGTASPASERAWSAALAYRDALAKFHDRLAAATGAADGLDSTDAAREAIHRIGNRFPGALVYKVQLATDGSEISPHSVGAFDLEPRPTAPLPRHEAPVAPEAVTAVPAVAATEAPTKPEMPHPLACECERCSNPFPIRGRKAARGSR
jgi:hypothetical protein